LKVNQQYQAAKDGGHHCQQGEAQQLAEEIVVARDRQGQHQLQALVVELPHHTGYHEKRDGEDGKEAQHGCEKTALERRALGDGDFRHELRQPEADDDESHNQPQETISRRLEKGIESDGGNFRIAHVADPGGG
jgi:hypothetical protein